MRRFNYLLNWALIQMSGYEMKQFYLLFIYISGRLGHYSKLHILIMRCVYK